MLVRWPVAHVVAQLLDHLFDLLPALLLFAFLAIPPAQHAVITF